MDRCFCQNAARVEIFRLFEKNCNSLSRSILENGHAVWNDLCESIVLVSCSVKFINIFLSFAFSFLRMLL